MSSNIEEIIPAFSSWKMFNETVPTLIKDRSESGLKRLSNIIQSKDYANIFIYSKDPTDSFNSYIEIVNKYKAFTTWLLGQFFYVISYENLANVHDTIIDTQLSILDHLSKTHLHVYNDFAIEYSKAFDRIVNFKFENGQSLNLEVFVPAKYEDMLLKLDLSPIFMEIDTKDKAFYVIEKMLKILRYILAENFQFYSFDTYSCLNLDNIISLLNKNDFKINIKIFEIYIDIIENTKYCFKDYEFAITEKICLISAFFNIFIHNVYNNNFDTCTDKELSKTEKMLKKYFELCEGFENPIVENVNNVNKFIYFKCLDNSKPKICKKLLQSCLKTMKISPVSENKEKNENLLQNIVNNMNGLAFEVFKEIILDDIFQNHAENDNTTIIELYKNNNSEILSIFQKLYFEKLDSLDCGKGNCHLEEFLTFTDDIFKILMKIKIQTLKNPTMYETSVIFFDEGMFLFKILQKLKQHYKICSSNHLKNGLLYDFLVKFSFVTNSKNMNIIFQILTYPYLIPNVYKSDNQLVDTFIGNMVSENKREIKSLHLCLSQDGCDKIMSLLFLNNLLDIITCGVLPNLNSSQLEDIGELYLKILKNIFDGSNNNLIQTALLGVTNALTILNNSETILSSILLPYFVSNSNKNIKTSMEVIQKIICTSSSDYFKTIFWEKSNDSFRVNIHCEKCTLQQYKKFEQKNKKIEVFLKETYHEEENAKCLFFSKNKLDISSSFNNILKQVLTTISNGTSSDKTSCIKVTPCFSNHITNFYFNNIIKLWLELLGDTDKDVRVELSKVILKTIKYGQDSDILSESAKKEILEILFSTLLRFTKKAIQYTDFELQHTLLETISEISNIKTEYVMLECIKILIYFIMLPTSKYSLIAMNKCFKIAEKNDTSTKKIYSKYKRELCEIIAHISCVNQALINYNLSTSLSKVCLMLEFCNAKEFASLSSNHMVPFLVSKVVKMPEVVKLLEELATLVDTDLAELFASKYGNIFLHVFMNENNKDEFKQIMSYLERVTGLNGPALRKRNFRIILNELLLNFYENKDRVLLALSLLAKEDSENTSNDIPDYLQSFFLGVLQYFDVKLVANGSKHDKILLSLSEIFRFMGPKHITPLRFKIVAMLQTVQYGNFPTLISEVWNSFLYSCDVEYLGPQLATIFVSLLPMIQFCPDVINNIFKYLIIENQNHTKDFIPDLFFVNNKMVDRTILNQIKKSFKVFENCNLQEKIKRFLKYLKHETNEVRIQGLKYLKVFMEQSREELDQMILGYNGIDQNIVELIDILTLGCREKDEQLKLAFADVIGELGAVEPTHLPRRYAQNDSKFAFFINEDSFIVSILNELTKAFQTEKNTHSMDRFALAIQEILKAYDISPDMNSAKSNLWRQFPESQQNLMLPLLSSRYMIAVQNDTKFTYPIYGSNVGISFESWLNSWTQSLICNLPTERKTLLSACFLSMKQDHRILMNFLPHIFLHSLLEGYNDISEKCYLEFTTITNSFNEKKTLDKDTLKMRSLPIPGMEIVPQNITPEEVKQLECTKVVFLLLDFLDRWLREWQWLKGQNGRNNENFVTLKRFQARFSKLQLAQCNYHCGEYPRALMYLEDYIADNPREIDNYLSFLAEIYAQLDEPDGVAGVTALQNREPSVEQRILALEVSGKLADAAACYERMKPPLKLHHLQGLVQCYLDLDNVNTALNFAQGAIDLTPEFGNMLLEMQAEPLWRLGRYDDLNDLLKKPDLVNNKSWGVQIGHALLHFKNGERDEFKNVLDALKTQQVEFLGAASLEEGAYQHGYSYISRLHALNELQQVEKCINELMVKPNDKNYAESIMKKLTNEWELRIKVVQESIRIIEPLLCMRRVALNLGKNVAKEKSKVAVPFLNSLLGESWLLSGKIARSAGVHQQAYTYTIKAEEYAPSKLYLEKARLHWLREEHEQALTTLKRGLDGIAPEEGRTQRIPTLTLDQRKIYAEAMLLTASYNDSISNVETDVNVQYYKESYEAFKEWEKSLVCLAQYYDRIFQTHAEEERDQTKGSAMQLHMINYFLKSLQYGTEYVYQSVPRILSIWFDFGTRLSQVKSAIVKEERKNVLLKMTKLIDDSLEKLPAFIFLTAFSQIISRICHPQKEVHQELKSIIIKLIQHYPQQSLWTIISVIKSSYAVRSKRCMEILSDVNLRNGPMTKLVKDFTALAEKLIELCNKEIANDVSSTMVSALLRTLPRMLNKEDFSEIMMPTQKFRKLVLPNPDFKSSQHNPFPNRYVHIVGIEDEITILPSLQRPRKITLRGSDGKGYIYMLKPKDDLRKDFRLMEFNDILNQLLSRDPEARQRRLYIRLYSVTPLNEECGLIEWVPNLVGLRPVITSLYRQKGTMMKPKEISDVKCNLRDSLQKKREVFTKVLIPRHPPVLGEWFRKHFPDAQNWLTARTAYIRSTAVMSIAGYILGLGDRHGENILLDSTCGDAVHVDFNCLFNKGEAFEWPERVPFRLTHNMVAAMGPLGAEGVFRKSCACALRVLRNNSNTLMSTVIPFVYDPLVSWPRNVSAGTVVNAERTNDQAVDHIKNIQLRLEGVIKTKSRTLSIPLSIEGQTNNLINEAMSIDNLCQMYIGWGPYL